jgi:dienelactone hydrolase
VRWKTGKFILLSFLFSACSSGGGELPDAGEEPVVEDGSDYDDDYDHDQDHPGTDRAEDGENENGVDEDPGSLCVATIEMVSCPHHTSTLETGTTGLITRDVHWMVPYGNPPPGGWPVVLMFQGSAFNPEHNWKGTRDDLYGAYYQVLVLKNLLDAGYAVLTPEAHLGGETFWDTNVPLYANNWESSPDHDFMLAIFQAVDDGVFGPIDSGRMYATGLSSGGYMTSRMAVSYPGRFKSLAIMAGSYATCAGIICNVPDTLPADHPPTLFLHGQNDLAVPLSTMEPYEEKLRLTGIDTRKVINETCGHEWIPEAPLEVLSWFGLSP